MSSVFLLNSSMFDVRFNTQYAVGMAGGTVAVYTPICYNKTMMKNIFPAVVTAALLLVFSSCASQIKGTLMGDGQADMEIQAGLNPKITALIKSFAALSGTQITTLMDGPSIAASMSQAPGIASVSFVNKSPTSIEGPVKISRINDLLASGRTGGFISFEQKNQAGEGRCAANLSLESGPQILSLLSPEIGAYLDLLMAPIASGEKMTKKDYLELVASIYGKEIADEIAGALIQVSLNFPGTIQRIKGGTFSGRRADFKISLLDVLVLETPLNYEVVWK